MLAIPSNCTYKAIYTNSNEAANSMEHSRGNNLERTLTLFDEAGHILVNASKGRLFQEIVFVRVGSLWGARTGALPTGQIPAPPPAMTATESNLYWVQMLQGQSAPSQAEVETQEQEQENDLPLADELMILQAGIEAEVVVARQLGLSQQAIRNIRARARKDSDYQEAVELIEKAGLSSQQKGLLRKAGADARAILTTEAHLALLQKIVHDLDRLVSAFPDEDIHFWDLSEPTQAKLMALFERARPATHLIEENNR